MHPSHLPTLHLHFNGEPEGEITGFSSPVLYNAQTAFGTEYNVSHAHPADDEMVYGAQGIVLNWGDLVRKYGEPGEEGRDTDRYWSAHYESFDSEQVRTILEGGSLAECLIACNADFNRRIRECFAL